MALRIPDDLGVGGARITGYRAGQIASDSLLGIVQRNINLKDVLNLFTEEARLMSHLKFNVAAGAGIDTDVTVTGITTSDVLLSVVRLDLDATAGNIDLDDLTSEASITDTNDVQLDTTDTTGDKLLIIWVDGSARQLTKSEFSK